MVEIRMRRRMWRKEFGCEFIVEMSSWVCVKIRNIKWRIYWPCTQTHSQHISVHNISHWDNQLPDASMNTAFKFCTCLLPITVQMFSHLFPVPPLFLNLPPSLTARPLIADSLPLSKQPAGQLPPLRGEERRFEVRMWASCCNKKLICLLAHYCGLWLPGPYKWKSNVALHYPFGIQVIARADTGCIEAPVYAANLHACQQSASVHFHAMSCVRV